MNRAELKQQIVALCEGSGLPVNERVAAVRAALTTVQLNVGLAPAQAKSFKPLVRPSGKMMGKQKREPKSE